MREFRPYNLCKHQCVVERKWPGWFLDASVDCCGSDSQFLLLADSVRGTLPPVLVDTILQLYDGLIPDSLV